MADLPKLNEFERRVLGVLIEKSLAQSAYYPMTLNAIVVGCNQKSLREPVMELDEETVWQTIESLRERGLVARLLPGGSNRADRFRHEVSTVLGWEKPQRAVMAELLLRGPQTTGELRTHCARMYTFENVEAVAAVLDTLAQRTPSQVVALPRAPGQSAVRFAHLLYPEPEQAALLSGAAVAGGGGAGDADRRSTSMSTTELGELRRMVDDLARRVAALEERER